MPSPADRSHTAQKCSVAASIPDGAICVMCLASAGRASSGRTRIGFSINQHPPAQAQCLLGGCGVDRVSWSLPSSETVSMQEPLARSRVRETAWPAQRAGWREPSRPLSWTHGERGRACRTASPAVALPSRAAPQPRFPATRKRFLARLCIAGTSVANSGLTAGVGPESF